MKQTHLRTLALLGVAIAGVTLALGTWIAWPLPNDLTTPREHASLTLVDRSGLVLRATRAADGSLRRWLSLADIDSDIIAAFIASEDHRFYEHHGVDPLAVGRALVQNIQARRVRSGASTITMQLARMLKPSRRTWLGKGIQVLWALRLERHLSKQQILEHYLNRVPLGQGTVGVEAAAALYFTSSATNVSLGQAALLAGLASGPSTANPFVAPERARARRALVLRRMGRWGYAQAAALDRARTEPLVPSRTQAALLAPHFTSRVVQSLEGTAQGVWRTSLDLPLQTALEAEVRHTVLSLSDLAVREAALVVLHNRTGEVLAWIGSPDFWSDRAGQVDMVVSPRQPGSALKPFLYGLAFDRGFTAASVLPDIPLAYSTTSGTYQPRNYDRHFHGPVRAREALASSYNVPAVELADRLGTGSLLGVLHNAGFASLTHSAEYYGLGLSLGNGDVTLLELANAYRGLAAGGVLRPIEWRAVDGEPRAPPPEGRRFMSTGSAVLVLDILADPIARIPGFGIATPFDFPFGAAVKTGTSHHFTDNWAVGVTGEFTVAVWVGNFNGQPMRGVGGVTGAGPLLQRAMLITARHHQPGALERPEAHGAQLVRVCALSGLLAHGACPAMDEWFLPGTAPRALCDWHRSGEVVWPAEYVEWASQSGRSEQIALSENTSAVVHRRSQLPPSSATSFQIVSPRAGDRYQVPTGVDRRYATIAFRAAGVNDGAVRWYLDGHPIAASRWVLVPGEHVVRAVLASGQTAEARFEVLDAIDNAGARP